MRSATARSESAGRSMIRTVGPRYRGVIPHGYRSGAPWHQKPLRVAHGVVPTTTPAVAHSMVMDAFMPAL
jgi:hypothetical protein